MTAHERHALHELDQRRPDQRRPDQRCIDTLRTLAIDQVQKANSGHPGTPMGACSVRPGGSWTAVAGKFKTVRR
jgi:Transketolase, thiamine diphosphate binding domain